MPAGKILKNRKRLLVTGASGLLGNKIIKLAEKDYSVAPTHRTKPLHSNSIELDITEAKDVRKVFHKFEPDKVIHTASETNVDMCEKEKDHAWKTNVDGSHNIALACSEVSATLVYISTDYVFDGRKGSYVEEDNPNPINYYGVTKLEGENQIIRNCRNYTILRTSVIYGWHPWKQNFATWVIESLRQQKEIAVVEDHYNTPTLADNLAQMALETSEKGLQGLYHASGSERVSRYTFAKQIAKTFNLDTSLIKPIKMHQLTAWIAERPKDSSLKTEKIQKHLKTKPLKITEGLNRMKREAEQ
ncbi:MAG: dTDP-4-dehydrorhamnose reductase [Candidatus Bathyarchaeota archaeon]|nr:dTDP-4-dehydrorhamnose reductase [Candidatus Bathyarchaeota archaeon]